jgi:hypothetical protein
MKTSSLPLLPLLLSLSAPAALGGCGSPGDHGFGSGEDFSVPPSPPEIGPSGSVPFKGREFFLTTAGPSLIDNCGGCHANAASGAPVFMGSTVDKSYILLSLYEGIIASPDDSGLLQQGTHAGPDLAAEERQIVAQWLNTEMAESSSFTDPSRQTLSQALAAAGGCMTRADWTDSGLDSITTLQTKDGQACAGCHSSGEHGVFISADPTATFEENRSYPKINRWVKGHLDMLRGTFLDLVPANVFESYSHATCDPTQFDCHPAYELPPELATAIHTVTTNLLDRFHNHKCTAL